MKALFELLMGNPIGIMMIIPIITIILIAVAIFYGKKDFIGSLRGIGKEAIIAAAILFVGYMVFLIPAIGRGFISSDEEWFGLNQAKNIVNGDLSAFNHSQKGIGYSLAVAGSMLVFGVNEQAAIVLNVFFSAFTIIIVGFTAYVISKNSIAAISASIGYACLPLVLKFGAFNMGYPAMGAFFMVLFGFFGLVALRERSAPAYIAMWLTVALAAQIKPEFSVLALPAVVLGIFLFRKMTKPKEWIKKNWLKTILAVIALFLLFLPFFIKYYQYNRNLKEVSGVTGIYLTQKTDYVKEFAIDILRPIANSRVSMEYLMGDIDNFVSFIIKLQWGTFSAVIAAGMVIALMRKKKEREDLWVPIFLIFSGCVISAVYMATDVVFDNEGGRFAFYLLPFFAPVFGYSLSVIADSIPKRLPAFVSAIPFLILTAYALNATISVIPERVAAIWNNIYLTSVSQGRSAIESGVFDRNKTVFYTKYSNLTNFLRFNGYNSHAFTDDNAVNTATSRDPEIAAREIKLTDWDRPGDKFMIIVAGDAIDQNDPFNPIIRAFIDNHAEQKISFDSDCDVYRLKQ